MFYKGVQVLKSCLVHQDLDAFGFSLGLDGLQWVFRIKNGFQKDAGLLAFLGLDSLMHQK